MKHNIKLIKIQEEIKEDIKELISNEELLQMTIRERIQARLNRN